MDLLKRALIPPPEVVLFLFVRQPFAPLNLGSFILQYFSYLEYSFDFQR